MVDGMIRWSIENKLAILLFSAVALIAGGFTASTMSVDIFPDLTAPTVTIITEGHGMAPDEMETLVTFPIETAVNGAAGVRRVRSGTAIGISVVWVEFEWGTDVRRARQTVAERLGTVSGSLPREVEPPVLGPISSIMGEIVFAAISSDRHDAIAVRNQANTVIRRRLLAIPGISQVTLIGGDVKQYQVVLSPERLRVYALTVDDVISAIERSNENVAAGILARGGQETVVQGIGRIDTEKDIQSVVVAMRDTTPVKVEDLGVVHVGAAIKRGAASASFRDAAGKARTTPAVVIAIQKQPSANTLTLTQSLDAVLDQIEGGLPAGMMLNKNLFRQASFIENSLKHTLEALRDGGAIVIVIVLLFLASFRASVITLLAIPISLAVAVICLSLMDASINTMTLGGMAIAIGALVDDAIIDVENIVRRLRVNSELPIERRKSVATVVYEASIEVRASIVFATLIILLVFSPLFFLSGVEGRLLFPLGVSFCVALGASMVTALTLTPVLASWLLPNSRTVRVPNESFLVRSLKACYAPLLAFAVKRPWIVTLPAILLLIAALFGFVKAGRSFLPEFNEGALVVGLVTLPGTSLEESDALARRVEHALMMHPEIVSIGRRTGRAEEDEHVQGVEASEIDLTLDLSAGQRSGGRSRTKSELLDALRADLGAIPGVSATFGQPIGHRVDHMLSGTRASIAIKIFSDDLTALQRLARQVEDTVRKIPGVVDLSSEQQASVPTLRIRFDRPALARHGLNIREVGRTVEAAFKGAYATRVIDGQSTTDVVVRLGSTTPALAADVGEIQVATPTGARVPLRELAQIDDDLAPNFISRENVQRKIVVMCNVSGRDVGGVVDEIRSRITLGIALPVGTRVEYGGQFETAEETRKRLTWLGLVVILCVGLILQIVFGSARDAILIMVNLPLALIGGVVGVYVGGGVISIASIIGFITVFGIAARNGILMVAHIHHLQEHEGVGSYLEAVRRGALERLTPILMTALAAGLALVPLAIRGGEPGTELLSPMALVILFGLLSSTFLNMLVVPALLVLFGRPRRIVMSEFQGSGSHV